MAIPCDQLKHRAQNQTIFDPHRQCEEHGHTAIYFATSIEYAEMLLDRGADINQQCGRLRHTPLFHHVLVDNLEMVTYLLSRNADPNIPSRHRNLALSIARSAEMAKLLIKGGTNLYHLNKFDETHMFYQLFTKRCHHVEVVEEMLKAGIPVNHVNDRNETLANYTKTLEMAQLLCRYGFPIKTMAKKCKPYAILINAQKYHFKADLRIMCRLFHTKIPNTSNNPILQFIECIYLLPIRPLNNVLAHI